METNNIKNDFQHSLEVEGINFKGFGVLPKYVMLDHELTIESKTIYAYFCSYAGAGNSAFPSRAKILKDLPISKTAYYTHFSALVEQGYITVKRDMSKGIKGNNTYIIVSNPKKFDDKLNKGIMSNSYNQIKISGLKSFGYGLIPKSVMLDTRLPLKAKGIYSYFCVFTGSGNSSFPKKSNILLHLNIAESTYYKFYKLLCELNYITSVQRHIHGKLSINDYTLNDTPNINKVSKKTIISQNTLYTEKQDIDCIINTKQYLENEDIEIQDIEIQDIVNKDININSTKINKYLYKYQSINQQKSQEPKKIDGLNETEKNKIIFDELWQEKKLPYWYKNDDTRLTEAIHIMTQWNTFYPNGYKNEFDQKVYELFNEALIAMCSTDKMMNLKGMKVSYAKVIDKINTLIKFNNFKFAKNDGRYISISDFQDVAINDFNNAAMEKEIKNHLQYMKACIWNALQIGGDINILAAIKRDFGD